MSNYLSSFELSGEFLQSLSDISQRIRTQLQPFIVPLLAVVTFVLAAILGLVAFKLEPRFVELALAGIAGFLLLLCGAEFVMITLIVISSTLVDVQTLPYLFGFSSPELISLLLVGLVLINHLSNRENFVHTPLDLPIFLFVGATIISLINAKYNLGTVSNLRNSVTRTMLVYLLFFAVTNLIKNRRQLMTLVGSMLVMATVVAGFMVAQQAVGSAVSIIPGRENVASATVLGQEAVGTVRVVGLPGVAMVYIMLLPALILHITPEYMKGRKWLLLISVGLLPLAVTFTFSRNLWLGAVGGGVIFILLSRLQGGRFVFLILIVTLGAVLLGTLLSAYFPRIETVAQGLSARFSSLFAGDELVYDSSTQGRLKENEYAIAKIKEYPFLGIGPMADYYFALYKNTHYVHNAYLWILLDFGIVGFVPVLWFSIAYLVRGMLYWAEVRDPILKGIVIGFTVSYIAVLISSVATPKLLELSSVPLIAMMLGINEVAMKLGKDTSH
jgi:O-antigen ligase